MKKTKLFLAVVAFGIVSLSSCSKGCYTCTAGEWEDAEICSTDGYGATYMTMWRENCIAGGGKWVKK